MERPARQLKIFSQADILTHDSQKSCWVTYKGKVYDISQFLRDHPGGDDVIMPYAGKDISEVMADPGEHEHSKSAYVMMDEFLIGRVVKAETIVSSSWEATDDFHPDDTDVLADYERSEFLDLAQPLLPQLWHAKFSKAFYLEQVHQPRHVSYSARLFPWPALEALTLTPWYIIPLVWGPITLTFTLLSLLQFSPETRDLTFRSALAGLAQGSLPGWWSYAAVAKTGACWTVGMFLWTLLEYGFHRCLFHVDEKLPDANWALLLHFLLHGVHHYLPMDGMRLVMPPTLFFMLQLPFTNLAHALFPASVANGLICGAFTAYICYDCFHYFFHHTKLPAYFEEQKKYHLAHHYNNFDLGYGVTSKIWDKVFGTELVLNQKEKKAMGL